ncbi:hypothetical protein V5O48_014045 [Marasmius crinis-equi]|uniref:DUF4105 domain-containing protein n=1 Tax=Marasmius crinis-equi TaxID=585013 RepID=A0ABR3EYE9_9AGAR
MKDPATAFSPGSGFLTSADMTQEGFTLLPYFPDTVAEVHYPPYPDGTDIDKQRREEELILKAVFFAGDHYTHRHFSFRTNNCHVVTARFLVYLIAHDVHNWITPTNWQQLWNSEIYKRMEKHFRKVRILRPLGKVRSSIGLDFAPWHKYGSSGQLRVFVRDR